jgi:hypothetical protein
MRKVLTATCLLGLLLAPSAAHAQFSLGVQGSWGDKTDWGLGGRATLDLTPRGIPVAVFGTYDYFWWDDIPLYDRSYWEVNINAVFVQMVGGPQAQSYFGLGLNIADFSVKERATGEESGTTDYGLNLLGGSKYKVSRLAPYFEIRYVIEGSEQLVLTLGLDVLLGREPF